MTKTQLQYFEYVHQHIINVNKALVWLQEHGLADERYDFGMHDESKFWEEEFYDYADYFYGEGKSVDEAWLRHIYENPHHFQHWCLIEDSGQIKALPMPDIYLVEMICDWMSFSIIQNNLYEVFDYYEKNKSNMILHPETRAKVEELLGKIKEILDSEAEV